MSQKPNAKSWPARWQFRAGALAVEQGTGVRSLPRDCRYTAAHRLAGVDAPDRHQPYSADAARQLSRLVRGQVRILWRKRDRSGTKVGIVLQGRRDLNLAMIESGCGWHFDQLNDELGATDRSRYASAQEAAARQRRGLWRQDRPVSPWALRQSPFR